jgi:hypothetical protein
MITRIKKDHVKEQLHIRKIEEKGRREVDEKGC